jgi:hypothetical protein
MVSMAAARLSLLEEAPALDPTEIDSMTAVPKEHRSPLSEE